MKRAISLILVALMMLLAVPAFSVAAAETAQSDVVVYLNGTAGADANDGKTAATAVATIATAVQLVNEHADAKSAVIVICGATSFGDDYHNVIPDSTAVITLTSSYGGVDYRNDGAKILSPNKNVSVTYFNGEYIFDCVHYETINTNAIICMQYNSLTVTENFTSAPIAANEGITTHYPILLLGYNGTGTMDKAAGNPTFSGETNVNINGGTWQYLRSGDRDASTTFDGTLTINLNAGKFLAGNVTETNYFDNANTNSATGKGNYGDHAKIVVNLNGGEFADFVGSCHMKSGNASFADVTININNGVKITDFFCAVQQKDAMFAGKLTINVNGGDLSGITESKFADLTAANGGIGVVTINHDPDNAASAAAFKALKDVCVDDAGVTYGTIKVEATTEPVVTTEAVVTTEVVVTTEATVDTTVAVVDTTAAVVDTTAAVVDTTAATGEVTPPTGDASLMVVFAAAAVLCVAAVIVIKKREN